MERNATVLVVEDDDTILRLATRVLERGGYKVLAAATGEEAMRLCLEATSRIALLLVDVALPDIRGPELGQSLREFQPSARILYMSGHSPDDLADVARLEHAHFLPKPFDPDQLLRSVAAVLEGTAE